MSLSQSEPDLHGTNRALWAAVVLQVKIDIENEALDSLDYAHAVAFVTGGGSWNESRLAIADMLEIHPDDITRMGRAWIAARRSREGLPAEEMVAAETQAKSQPAHVRAATPMPIAAAPAPVVQLSMVRPVRTPANTVQRSRTWRKNSGINPFSPFRHQLAARTA